MRRLALGLTVLLLAAPAAALDAPFFMDAPWSASASSFSTQAWASIAAKVQLHVTALACTVTVQESAGVSAGSWFLPGDISWSIEDDRGAARYGSEEDLDDAYLSGTSSHTLGLGERATYWIRADIRNANPFGFPDSSSARAWTTVACPVALDPAAPPSVTP